jgi:hypothetical protein
MKMKFLIVQVTPMKGVRRILRNKKIGIGKVEFKKFNCQKWVLYFKRKIKRQLSRNVSTTRWKMTYIVKIRSLSLPPLSLSLFLFHPFTRLYCKLVSLFLRLHLFKTTSLCRIHYISIVFVHAMNALHIICFCIYHVTLWFVFHDDVRNMRSNYVENLSPYCIKCMKIQE